MLPGRDRVYANLARLSGLVLVVVAVMFQRRGALHWAELAFLGLCIGLQEVFVHARTLRRYRSAMFVMYSMLPIALIGLRADAILPHRGEFVPLVINTPLSLVFVSVQVMVLYAREAPRLASVVLVLALFSTVIGLRRPVDGAVWPWLAAIGGAACLYLAMLHPAALRASLVNALNGRVVVLGAGTRPAAALRPAWLLLQGVFVALALVVAGGLFFAMPRPAPIELPIPTDPADAGGGTGIPPPRLPNGQGGGHRDNVPRATLSGLGAAVTLGDFGTIQLDEREAVIVTPRGQNPRRESLYLRAFTYGEFDGTRWLPLPAQGAPRIEVPEGTRRELPAASQSRVPAFTRRVYHLEWLSGAVGQGGELPAPVEPISVLDLQGPLDYGTQEHTLRLLGDVPANGASGTIEARELTASQRQLQILLADKVSRPGDVSGEYRALPAGLRDRIRAVYWTQESHLFDELEARANARNTRDSAERRGAWAAATRIVQYFHGMRAGGEAVWRYSLEQRPAPGPDAIVRFLDLRTPEAQRYGHCEYFASAMVVLMRCFGVPARLAAGFLCPKADDDGVFRATFANAHAWVEVWLPDLGWVAFDPTPPQQPAPAADPEPVPAPEPEPQPTQPEPEPAAAETDWFRDYDGRAQQQVFADVGAALNAAVRDAGAALDRVTAWMPSGLPGGPWSRGALLVLPGVLLAAYWLLSRRRRRKLAAAVLGEHAGEAGTRELGLYVELLLLAGRYGFHKAPHETPREFAARVRARGGRLHEAMATLTEMYYAFRYGAQSGVTDSFKRGLADYAAALKAAENPAPETPAGT